MVRQRQGSLDRHIEDVVFVGNIVRHRDPSRELTTILNTTHLIPRFCFHFPYGQRRIIGIFEIGGSVAY